MNDLMKDIMAEVRSELFKGTVSGDEDVRQFIVRSFFNDERSRNISINDADNFIKGIFYRVRSKLGILQPLVDDKEVSEIMANGPNNIFIEKKGNIEKYDMEFDSVDEMEDVMRNIAAFVHREINEMNPILDARLEDGSRVNCVYKNVALNGPVITIRKFSERYMTMENLIEGEMMTEDAGKLLKCLVACGCNIFISGGTSTRQDNIFKCTGRFYSRAGANNRH